MIRKHSTLLALVLALGLLAAGCAGGAAPTTAAPAATTAAPTDTTEAVTDTTEAATTTAAAASGEGITVGMAYDIGGRGDQSFNDAAARGLDQAIADFGIASEELEPEAGGENREENLRLLAEAGLPLIFAVGFLFTDSVLATAPDFPDTNFALIDSVVEEPNVANLLFAEEQGSFLVGAAAALKSESGTIGFIGGVEVDLIKKFQAGFEAGVAQINPDAEVLVTYLTQPPDFTGFNDPAKGKEAALAQFEQGADVIYHAAGGSGGGLFEAAREVSDSEGSQHWAIGVDSDQYNIVDASLQPYILTSMLKRVDVATYETITDLVEGNFQAGIRIFDLAADGVGYATSGGFVDDIAPQLEELRQQIIDGEIEVPTAPES
ncbi:MAG: BMP family lipoprotein [Acidimicrobiia bacterium]